MAAANTAKSGTSRALSSASRMCSTTSSQPAEWLIANKYTSTPKLAIGGRSNGGLLVGACLTQRPDLFGATLPGVGVMDMLRFHQFTIGWAWKSDYGSSENPEEFKAIYKYSPLHNLKSGVKYPPTLIVTADHDDRVYPAHSFKFAATMQEDQAADAPVLIRIETRAGHGAGKPITKVDRRTDGRVRIPCGKPRNERQSVSCKVKATGRENGAGMKLAPFLLVAGCY